MPARPTFSAHRAPRAHRVESGPRVRRGGGRTGTGPAARTRSRPGPWTLPGLHRLFGVLALVLVVLLGGTLFLTSSAFGVSEIVVTGSTHLTDSEIIRLCGVDLGTNIFKVPTTAVRDRLMALPRVAQATVSRRLPGTLVVSVVEREGVALLPCGQQFAELDASGLPIEFHRFIGALGLPVVTGVAVEGVTLGRTVQAPGLDAALATAAALGAEGRTEIAEIHIDADGQAVLYTRPGTPVYVGQATGLDVKIPTLLGILADVQTSGLRVSYIDVRYPRYPVVGSAGGPSKPAEWQWADPDAPVLGEP